MQNARSRSRRRFLGLGAAWSAALVACRGKAASPAPEPKALGAAVSPYGSRSKFEKTARFFNQNTKVPLEEASSRTPLHDTYGIITPSSLHFERHHSGVPEIDPSVHTLTIHGLVDRPLVFSVDELKRLPSVSRIHFLECSGNSGGEWRGGSTESDVQRIHGLTSCSEWTGVPVAAAAARMRRPSGRDLGAGRRRRREQARPQHPDEEDHGRCDGRRTGRTASRCVPSRAIRSACCFPAGKATRT